MKIVWFGDGNIPSGFGRISDEICTRLVHRGHQVSAVSLLWDGIMCEDWYAPAQHNKPYHISGVAGRDPYAYLYNIINLANPDVVVSCQDFPYAHTIYYGCRIDWSRRAFVVITPIDGEPVYEDWLNLVDDADGTAVISEFGVEALRKAGRRAVLCAPGIDLSYFKPVSPEERQALRAKAGIPNDAFVLGMMAMNQGRKDIPHTIEGFWRFAIDKPNAYLLLDMEKSSPAGWDIPKQLLKPRGIPESRVLFKDDLIKKGLKELRDRFALLDAHSVLSHREGFGLPLVEGQAMGIPSIAAKWCSGPEICGDGKGYLVNVLSQPRNSTWGGALDYDPDVDDFARILQLIYDKPELARGIAAVGGEWARGRNWDVPTDAIEQLLTTVTEKKNARNRDRALLQPTAPDFKTLPVDIIAPPKEGEADYTDRRHEPGVQPNGAGWSAIPSSAKREELGVRDDGERRDDPGKG